MQKAITLHVLQKLYAHGEKLTCLTCYDASFAQLLANAGIEILLVGDSANMVIAGRADTVSASLDQMVYHTRCVAACAKPAFVLTDLPFGTYQASPQQAFASAAQLMQAGAHMVKLEGGRVMAETVQFLTERGIPVCAHIGLTPQTVHHLGGFKVQGKTEAAANELLMDAKALEAAGASMLVLEMIPATLAQYITQNLSIPTIGIGAGADCSGQVLVLYDMLGIYHGHTPKFARNFMQGADSITQAVANYVAAVKQGTFPAAAHVVAP